MEQVVTGADTRRAPELPPIDPSEPAWRGLPGEKVEGAAPSIRERLWNPGAWRWYAGASFGLIYQVLEIVAVLATPLDPAAKTIGVIALAIIYVVFLLIPPLLQPERIPVRIAAVIGYAAFTCVLFPLVGPTAVWVWTLVVVMAGFTWMPRIAAFAIVAALVLAQFVVAAALGWPDSITFAPFITASVGISTVTFAQQILQTIRLRQANSEIARLAVGEERLRLARDLHDSLGHSLTVIAMKAELAQRLVELAPDRAVVEIAGMEQLARDGLTDLRQAVAGYRDVLLETELASAATALQSAGIRAHLPADPDVVDPRLRPLFGWVVREGVTNVLRHAQASTCWIEVDARRIAVRDDGRGARDPGSASSPSAVAAESGSTSHGLLGLSERAEAVGAHVVAGSDPAGGFRIEVSR